MPKLPSQSKSPVPQRGAGVVAVDSDEIDQVDSSARDDWKVEGEASPVETEKDDRAARRKHYVRLFCFACNRYEGHSVADRSRLFYSFLTGVTFGLYYFFGRHACHCCGTVRLARSDWLNLRFLYRRFWIGGSSRNRKAKSKNRSKSRRNS